MDDYSFDFDELMELLGNSDGTGLNVMQEELDREMNRLQSRLSKEYKQAEKELKKRAEDYFARFAERDKLMSEMVSNGLMSADEYIKWRQNKILYGENLKNQITAMSEYLANVNQQAMDVVNGRTRGIYAHNYNFGKYEVEKGFGINTSFTLFDERSIERLARKNPKLLPNYPKEKMVNIPKDKRWSKRKINNVITQGILQGKPLKNIANDLSQVVGMEERAALRNARTAMTGAQNAGRLDSYLDSKRLGINLKKQWMATLDERTRTSHADLDGESVDIDKEFSNKLQFPADPEGKPAEVYNCRCTMVADLVDFPNDKFQRRDNISGQPIDNMTYKEWMRARMPKQPKPSVINTANMKEYEQLKKYADSAGIEHRKVGNMGALTPEEIIDKLAGGDMTTGSCASLAFAYCSNHHGLDVIDFRGGKSQSMFSSMFNIKKMFKISNADVIMHEVEREAKDTAKILAGLEKDKLYYLATGRHAAIVRNDSTHGLQYLEMQSSRENGFIPFQTGGRSVEETLRQRFGCRKTIHRLNLGGGQKMTLKKKVYLVDVDSMQMTEEFKDMMGYINTAKDKQKKGVHGGRK